MDIEQVIVEGRGYARTVWFSAGPKGTSHPLCVFLDGDHYLERVDAAERLAEATADGRLPRMTFAFVAHHSALARHQDYTCNERFARFIAEDLVAWARQRVDGLRAADNIICGLSLSGLASAHIALTHPQVFASALCQSGSFWWSDQRLATLARERHPITSRYWLSVGDQETEQDVTHPPTDMYQGITQIAGARAAADALADGGAEVSFHLYAGGHEFEPWRDELCDALQWLGGGPAGESPRTRPQ